MSEKTADEYMARLGLTEEEMQLVEPTAEEWRQICESLAKIEQERMRKIGRQARGITEKPNNPEGG